ncbi:uncharacterized protein [Procambarus clarkii]|uniref:uncharacterized protein n=1 Tax=Procambarus clarkii TaxID=6728 RepID=UPI001E674BD4|nr:uncharacterized protein LOC123771805 [Procambarus clarkii]
MFDKQFVLTAAFSAVIIIAFIALMTLTRIGRWVKSRASAVTTKVKTLASSVTSKVNNWAKNHTKLAAWGKYILVLTVVAAWLVASNYRAFRSKPQNGALERYLASVARDDALRNVLDGFVRDVAERGGKFTYNQHLQILRDACKRRAHRMDASLLTGPDGALLEAADAALLETVTLASIDAALRVSPGFGYQEDADGEVGEALGDVFHDTADAVVEFLLKFYTTQ